MSASAGFAAFAEVALALPVLQSFSYGVPGALLRARPGCRVRVRFGARSLVGCVLEVGEKTPSLPEGARLQPLLALLDPEPVLTASQLELARWIADYYVAPLGIVLRAMLPPETPREQRLLYRRVEGVRPEAVPGGDLGARLWEALSRPRTAAALARAVGRKSVSGALAALVQKGLLEREQEPGGTGRGPLRVRVCRITDEGRRALATEKLHPATIRVLTLLAVATDAVPLSTIRNELGIGKGGPFRGLAAKGYVEILHEEIRRTPWNRIDGGGGGEPEIRLTEAQGEALSAIAPAIREHRFQTFVLRGVTGSGKTEVYLRSAEMALAAGRTALLLVPEIALTPRLAGLLRSRFGDEVAILHSALGWGERRDEWWRIRQGQARVVVGARAAALAPVEGLGLVVVDEEHESSYKQEESPRYSARDLALVRARNDGAVAVLGSATPSLESFTHAVEGRYRLLSLRERIGQRPLAEVELVDMRRVVREEGPDTVISRPLREAMEKRLAAGEQVVVLLNRRGYAGQLHCRECGLVLQCSDCSVAMTLHRQGTLAVCHYCGLGRSVPETCDTCGGEYLRQVGYGTERVEELLRSLFPGSRVARMDRDTMRRKGSHEALLARFARKEIDVLVGTQMVAKGHDFPAVTLVGVLAADNGLSAPDFRAGERTFQLLTQVAGRAGRGAIPGDVLIQTFAPEHYSLQFARAQDFEGFYETERKFRSALLYPPAVSLVNLIVEGGTMARAASEARRVAAFLKRHVPEEARVLGPAFAVRSKLAGRHRCQVLIKVPRRRHPGVRAALRAMLKDESLARAVLVDVDPLTIS